MSLIGLGIILSFIIVIVLGLIGGNKIKGKTENFTVAGRSLPFTLVGFALLAQSIDGNATLGNTSLSFDFGFWAGATLPIGLAISLFILGKFFAGRLNSLKLITMADFFERKYNQKIAFIVSIILLFGFGVLLAGNIATVGILLKFFFSIKYETAVIVTVLVILLYVIRGGIISDIYSDLFQMGVLTAGIVLTFIFLIANYGLINFSFSQGILQKFSLSQLSSITDGALINWATIVALGFGNLIAIDFGSRIFSAKSPKDAERGCYLGGLFTLVLGIPFSLLIFYILQLNISVVSDTPILVTFATKILPPSIAAILIAGLVNSAMSTVDGGMLSMGNILTRNILQIKPETNTKEPEEAEKTTLYFLRLSLLPIAFAAMIFAILMPSPGALLSIAFDITFAALLIPFVFAFTKYNDAQAALYAIIFGGVSRIILATLTPTLFGLPNPLYIQNTFVNPSLDGLGTMFSPLLALIVYVYILKTNKNKNLANAK